jgi:hypothetical protein
MKFIKRNEEYWQKISKIYYKTDDLVQRDWEQNVLMSEVYMMI